MSHYSRTHLSDSTLLHQFAAHVARDQADTAELLADLAEIDARRLYLPAGYPNLHLYCVEAFHLSEDAAFRRIRAARAARDFPAIFTFVADGRLSLTAVITLAPHLTAETVDDLLAAATHKTKAAIALLLAQRFPQPDLPTRIEPLGNPCVSSTNDGLDAGPQRALAPARVESGGPDSRITPLAPGRHAVQFTMDQEACDLLREARELLGHRLQSADVAAVIKGALRVYVGELKRRKFGATERPRAAGRPSTAPRYVPAHVKRAVWERDGGRCTFVSDTGKRCPARALLEFDHVLEVARGGRATVDGMRLRCQAHNQYTAERTFGAAFMRHKRAEARRTAVVRRRTAQAARRSTAPSAPPAPTACTSSAPPAPANAQPQRAPGPVPGTASHAPESDVLPWLRRLGFRAAEARDAAAFCSSIADASLEARLRAALSYLSPRAVFRGDGQPRG